MPIIKEMLAAVFLLTILTACAQEFNPFKLPISEQQDVAHYLKEMEQNISQNRWQEAMNAYQSVQSAWKDIENRVYLNADTGELSLWEMTLKEISAYLELKNQALALGAARKLNQLWEGIARL
jgi:hypothetical protein